MGTPPRRWTAYYRLPLGLLTYAALATQLVSSIHKGASVVNFFSFFTVLSNLLAATVFVLTAVGVPRRAVTRDLLRGFPVMPMAATGLVWFVALRDLDEALQTTIPWVNTVVHIAMPVIVVLDWLVDPPGVPIPLRRALVWLGYPIVWAAYTLVRGPLAHWYPYPFLDPAQMGGAGGVAVAVLVVGVLMLVLVLAAAAAGNALSRRATPLPASVVGEADLLG
ncbi:MAG TPA: Pr6Pr family membrane protein [Motilibacteraceae bacterium]|nr:Pr6Pr family membrane protein [Motilibacteraceae bacterium]